MSQQPSRPSVSVVVPTRDRPEQLRRSVEAILTQEYEGDIECVVVFDQSDPHEVPVPVHAGRALRIIRNERTPGLAGARNTGVLASGGDLIGFCDDDDEWLPGKLLAQVAELQRRDDIVAVAAGIVVANGARVIERIPSHRMLVHADLMRSRVMEVNPCTILLRREVFMEVGLVDEDIPGSYYEDYDWLIRCTARGPVSVLPNALVRINWHESSFFAERWRVIVDALEYMLGKYPEFARDRRGLARMYGQLAFANAASGQGRSAWHWIRRTLAADMRERRAYLAMAVAAKLVKPQAVLKLARSRGKGI